MLQANHTSPVYEDLEIIGSFLTDSSSSSSFQHDEPSSGLCGCCKLRICACDTYWPDVSWDIHLLDSSSVVIVECSERPLRTTPTKVSVSSLPIPRQIFLILTTLSLKKTQLAKAMGISRQAIYGWLKNTEPSREHLQKLILLSKLVTEATRETNRPIYAGYVFNSVHEGLLSIYELLELPTWDESTLREAILLARRLTSERDREKEAERQSLISITKAQKIEREDTLNDNLFALD